MGAAADSFVCLPGDCGPSDAESDDCHSQDYDVTRDLMVPSAIHGGEAWKQAIHIPKTTLPDIEITVSLFKTDICLSGSDATIEEQISKAEELLEKVRKGKHIDKRNSDEQLSKRPEQYSIKKILDKKRFSRSADRGSSKSSSKDSSLEKYEFRLPPWSDTWRLKCVVAKLCCIPAKEQFLVCNNMTAQNSVQLNHPATLLTELPAYSEHIEKPKPPPLLDMPSISTSGGNLTSPGSVKTHTSGSPCPRLDLVVIVPHSLSKGKYKQGRSVDLSDGSSKYGPSFCINFEHLDGHKPEETNTDNSHQMNAESFQSVIKLRPTGGSTWRSSAGAQDQPEYPYSKTCSSADKGGRFYSYGVATGDSVGSEQSLSQSIEDLTPDDLRDENRQSYEFKDENEKKMDDAERVFLEMNMLTDQADLLQVMVGLTKFGVEKPELAQAKMFFESMNCKISELITVDHIRAFLSSPQKDEDEWLTWLREVMLSQVSEV